ncbi:MAG: FecCD family ABC transporter permease [Acutalibacter sp.]|jgi:iron complex transport system permease protein
MSISPKSSIPTSSSPKTALRLGLLLALLVLSALAGVAAGSTSIQLFPALSEVLSGTAQSADARILLHVRLPRVCASLLSGSALAVSGMLIQAVLSNPLASPNVIGVNAGAGFFTFLALALFPGHAGTAPLGAFFGALLATLIVYAVAAGAGAGKLTIILAGVAVSSIFTAGINTIKTFFPETLYNGSTFLIGGFAGVSFSDISPAWIMILPALVLAFLLARPIDVLCLGEETAHSLGLPVGPTRFALILLACILAGSAVSFSGLVSFVGLLVPHIVRRLFGQGRHRVLIPAAILLGASFVTLCDLLSRVLFAPYEIPVGILLSFLGGPFFLFLIVKQRRHHPQRVGQPFWRILRRREGGGRRD